MPKGALEGGVDWIWEAIVIAAVVTLFAIFIFTRSYPSTDPLKDIGTSSLAGAIKQMPGIS